MPTSPWTDYLRRVAAYLHGGQNALESGRTPPAEPVVPRPDGPLDEQQAWLLMDLLAEASGMLDVAAPVPGRHAARARNTGATNGREIATEAHRRFR